MKRQRSYAQSNKYSGRTGGYKRARRRSYTRPSVARTRGALVTTERKYYDTGRDAANIVQGNDSWAGGELDPATTNCLFAPTEGNGIEQRVGNKVWVHKISVNINIALNTQTAITGADYGQTARLALVLDKQTNGTQLSAEDVFNSASTLGKAAYMFQNTDHFGRFQVLREKYVVLNPVNNYYNGTNIDAAGYNRHIKLVYKFKKPLCIRFNGTSGGTVADIIDNSFHLIGITNTGDSTMALDYKCRVVFTDP